MNKFWQEGEVCIVCGEKGARFPWVDFTGNRGYVHSGSSNCLIEALARRNEAAKELEEYRQEMRCSE